MNPFERFAAALPQRQLSELLLFLIRTDHQLIEIARKYVIFVTGGSVGVLIATGTTASLTEFFDWHPRYSYALGLFFAMIFTFLFHSNVTFKNTTRWKTRFTKFAFLVVALAIMNWTISSTLFEILPDIHYLIIIVVVTVFISVVNYSVSRWWVFR